MLRNVLFALLAATAFSAVAQPQVESLGKCLAENTTGKDRKDLARWVFLGMAAHPEMKELSRATPAAAEDSSRTTARLFTKLLAETCTQEVRSVMSTHGAMALQLAFQSLGQLAMQELMADRAVSQSMASVERYIDQQKINEVLRGK